MFCLSPQCRRIVYVGGGGNSSHNCSGGAGAGMANRGGNNRGNERLSLVVLSKGRKMSIKLINDRDAESRIKIMHLKLQVFSKEWQPTNVLIP